ncbi:hypothetical protein ACWGB8_21685 [Kitasatospora sp. NPDC054939]
MRHSDPTRSTTEHLSRFLSGPDGTLALARMQTLALPPTRSTDLPVPTGSGTAVGVWQLTDGRLQRDPARREDWRYWADLPELPLTPGRRRVAVVGESATRGYFFDPEHSLASLLGEATGTVELDVLDLARTNCSLAQLLRTVADACALGADALVVHAGNNWNNVDPTPVERQELAALLTRGGFPAAAAAFRDLVTDVGSAALDVLHRIAGDRLVVLVVPEFNLADWQDEPALDHPALPAGRLPRWRDLRRAAEQALDAGDLPRARTLAAELTALDGGSSPVGQRLLARCATTPEEALDALQSAKDAVVSPFAMHSPRILAPLQDRMRTRGAELGFHVVDQAALFRDGAGEPAAVPGRRWFLDYCHLTWEGLHTTALAVARALTTALGTGAGSPSAADGAPQQPAADRLALAHFLAAVHNAHYGQPEEILRHHLARALDTDPAVADRFEDYLDYQTRTAPNWMCASYERSTGDPSFRRYMVVGDGRLNGKLADHLLRELMLDELERRGVRLRERYRTLLVAEHGTGTDLLADAHLATTFNERRDTAIGRPTAYLRAAAPTTRSTVVLAEPAPLVLDVTWRLPVAPGPSGVDGAGEAAASGAADLGAAVSLAVNGREVGSTVLGAAWTSETFTVDAEHLHPGLNTVEIHWPAGDGTDALLAGAADRLECGETVPGHPVHGHVHHWSVTRTAPATA